MDLGEYEAQLKAVETALAAAKDEQYAELLELKNNLLELLELAKTDVAVEEPAAIDDKHGKHKTDNELASLKSTLDEMIGQECAAPHRHTWGALVYHNAFVCGVGDSVELDSDGTSADVMVRVLYTNPTHREMVPCEYFLEGNCRFDEANCRYSHGELVSFKELKDYERPNFQLLARHCIVLAKLKDRLWHRGRVLFVNDAEKTCVVRLESKEHKPRERAFHFEDLLPIYQDDVDSSDSSEDTTSSGESELEGDDLDAVRHAMLVEKSLLTCQATQPLGEWEQYTRGIGSKLMSKMGYVIGTGLGSDGRGIVTPVSAQILPQGRSLDHCMELREQANGDENLFSVERKLKRQQKQQAAASARAYERSAERVDVFSFLNNSVLASCSSTSADNNIVPKKTKKDLSEQTNRALNVESMRIADDIRRKEREISRVRESITRNSSDKQLQKRLQAELTAKSNELHTLQQEERNLTKEQTTRKTKDKLCVF